MDQTILPRRLAALRRLLRRAGADAMLLTNRHNVRYFSGFTGEDSYLLVERAVRAGARVRDRRRVTLLTDGRFAEQAELECPRIRKIVRQTKMLDAVVKGLAGRGVRVLGVEGNDLTVSRERVLKRGLKKIRLKPLRGEVDALREIKDGSELAAITRAIRLAEAAMMDLVAGGARNFIGRTERQVAAELEYRMRLRGADRAAFETIVAAGAHSSLPHYRAGDTKIRRRDIVLVDWGASVGGYCSDLTRVIFTGTIPPQLGRIYEIVLRAREAGMGAVGGGASCASVDAAARAVVAKAGYGAAFAHGLGHGIGLEVHESPRVGRQARQRLRAGMVVTVEPGIYLPGVGGVRIEDDVLVTAGGGRRLSGLPSRLADWVLRK